MKKIISLLISCMLMMSMVGCGDYLDKCDPEYMMIGQLIYDDYYGGTNFYKKLDLILDINDGKDITFILDNVDTFKWVDGESHEFTFNKFKLSKENNEDGQFSDAQFGILHKMSCDLHEKKDEFIETFGDNESFVKTDSDLYNDIIDAHDTYIAIIDEIIEDYDGELSEEELKELRCINSRYYELMVEGLMEEFGRAFMNEVINNLSDNY